MKPMLACSLKNEVPFPVYASPKIDGIRAIVKDGKLLSRTLKLIPNREIQSYNWKPFEGLDGELVVGKATDKNVMQNTTSGVMSKEGNPDWTYYVFDLWNSTSTYMTRMYLLNLYPISRVKIQILEQILIYTQEQLDRYEEACLDRGFEGVMLRMPESLYKFGRSTEKEFALVKVKRFEDAEATIIGYKELMHNNLSPGNTLGSLMVHNKEGVEFEIGTGFTLEQRAWIWLNRDEFMNKIVKYKFFNGGIKVAPRFPVFLGFRSLEDL